MHYKLPFLFVETGFGEILDRVVEALTVFSFTQRMLHNEQQSMAAQNVKNDAGKIEDFWFMAEADTDTELLHAG